MSESLIASKIVFLKEKSVRSLLSYSLVQGGLFILFIPLGMGPVCVHVCTSAHTEGRREHQVPFSDSLPYSRDSVSY